MPRELNEVFRDLKRGLIALDEAAEDYRIAEEMYDGCDPEVDLTDEQRRQFQGTASLFRLNLASIPVDAVADRLYVSSFSSQEDAVVGAINQLIDDNDMWSWANEVMRGAEKYGDYYVGCWPQFKNPTDASPSSVILSPMDPLTTRIIYDEELQRVPEFGIRYWDIIELDEGGNEVVVQRATITYTDEIYKFIVRGSKPIPFQPTEDSAWPVPNESGTLPYVHFRNAMPYGRPRHRAAYGIQQMITKFVIYMMANVGFMGFPQRWLLKNSDKIDKLPGLQTKTKDGVVVSARDDDAPKLKSGAGTLWELFGAAVGEFSPTDAEQFLALIRWASSEGLPLATRMPQRLFSDSSGQQPSGDSQRENDKALQDMVSSSRRSYAAAWVRVWTTGLAMLGDSDVDIETEWMKDEVERDNLWWEGATAALAFIQEATDLKNIPFITSKLREAGYSEEEIDEFLTLFIKEAKEAAKNPQQPVVPVLPPAQPATPDNANPQAANQDATVQANQ